MYPITKKGSMGTARMRNCSPGCWSFRKVQETPEDEPGDGGILQEKGYNPMSGCLPLLLLFTLFIASTSLNNHFDIRGASFSGWISDFPAEAIYSFSGR
jgi:YidC/Oxa1 family membrane protein insertase